MPTYKPLGTSVHLAAYSLVDSTSSKPQRSKNAAGSDTKRAEQALLTAPALAETHVPCFGDSTRLHFLGDVPFYLVQVGGDCFKPKNFTLDERVKAQVSQNQGGEDEASQKQTSVSQIDSGDERTRSKSGGLVSSRGSGLSKDISIPRALGLVIKLPQKTFLPSFETKKGAYRSQSKFRCVKYDVFFNGELAVSDFQPARYRYGRAGTTQPLFEDGNIRIVSGKRVGLLVERPWIILPPSRNTQEGLREVKSDEMATEGAAERWHALSKALLRRAEEQGYNSREERSPLGQYLANLASMEMPESVRHMQKPGGHKFGVIDVIITAGSGGKGQGPHRYLSGPEPLWDSKNFKRMPEVWQTVQQRDQLLKQQSHDLSAGNTMKSTPNNERITRTWKLGTESIATTRQKRKVATPATYRDLSRRRTLTSAPEHSTSTQSKRRRILPDFPAVPQLDFNDVIAITPTKAEEARKQRGNQTGSSHSARIPFSTSMTKRRLVDTISVDESESPSHNGTWNARPGAVAGSKSVSGYMGMTKRGVFRKRANTTSAEQQAPTSEIQTADGELVAQEKDMWTIKRVFIGGKDAPIIDKVLSSPYSLQKRCRLGLSPSVNHQPLDESVVFGLRNVNTWNAATKVQSLAASSTSLSTALPAGLAPQPATNQTRLPDASFSLRSALSLPLSLNTGPQPQSKFGDPLEETRATWRMPELSKDCVISFAEEGEWLTAAGKGSVLRHIRSSRAGNFTEHEVIFAVRYIVAGESQE
ncbi:uncharacterized protein PV09_00904 [Verruconis gallopava]|uniref:Uncharacterized protein n=1 Tax=Verruconis gallopava TaxID=253628 RepID=A0A0D1Z7V0_9PEZI|nr:uncharacterized protein PV09_00904 [Verruconis gallopava]KIW09007.1 hypothetical protein PV09_00904 [Verruconis gallopava]